MLFEDVLQPPIIPSAADPRETPHEATIATAATEGGMR
eukprot:gene9135-1938_t